MRLRVYSDLHLELHAFVPPVDDYDAVVLAGDIHEGAAGVEWARGAFGVRDVIYVAGNHEHYGRVREDVAAEMRAAARGSRVHVLEEEALVLDGVRFLGCTLWSDFELTGDVDDAIAEAQARGLDYREIARGAGRKFRPGDAVRAHRRALEWLGTRIEEPHDGPTVIVTHHAPSAASLPERYLGRARAAAYASDLDAFVAETGASVWIHGHVHHSSDYRLGETRVVCNPRGTATESGLAFDAHFTVEV